MAGGGIVGGEGGSEEAEDTWRHGVCRMQLNVGDDEGAWSHVTWTASASCRETRPLLSSFLDFGFEPYLLQINHQQTSLATIKDGDDPCQRLQNNPHLPRNLFFRPP